VIQKELDTLMMNNSAPWWRKCVQLARAKTWKELRAALLFGAH